jgi:hypothetical protein
MNKNHFIKLLFHYIQLLNNGWSAVPGKVCNCLIQFLLTMVLSIYEPVFLVEYVFREGNIYSKAPLARHILIVPEAVCNWQLFHWNFTFQMKQHVSKFRVICVWCWLVLCMWKYDKQFFEQQVMICDKRKMWLSVVSSTQLLNQGKISGSSKRLTLNDVYWACLSTWWLYNTWMQIRLVSFDLKINLRRF